MPRKRFENILSAIRFDDADTRVERRNNDKLAALREVVEILLGKCKQAYVPNPILTIDEWLSQYRGGCPFKMFMPKKPAKFGIKLWMLVDCETKYIWNFQVYTGKKKDGPEKNLGEKVVLDLVQDLPKGYGITTDSFFTSYSLALKLLNQGKTLLGTVNRQRKEVPEDIKNFQERELKSSFFLYSDPVMIVSYKDKKTKNVIVLSTQHHEPKIAACGKPEMIIDYNSSKFGVDIADMMIGNYSCSRTTRRWTLALFESLLDISILNMSIIWNSNKQKTSRSDFIEELCLELVDEQVSIRDKKFLSFGIKQNIEIVNQNLQFPNHPTTSKESSNIFGKCQVCRNRTRRNICCKQCKNFVCKKHISKTIYFCTNCKNH